MENSINPQELDFECELKKFYDLFPAWKNQEYIEETARRAAEILKEDKPDFSPV